MQLINEIAARLIFSKATGCDINKTIGLFERWFKDGTGKIDAEELGLMIALEVSIQGKAMSFEEVDLRSIPCGVIGSALMRMLTGLADGLHPSYGKEYRRFKMEKEYNFEMPERVTYGGPWISLTNSVFLFRSATGTGLFEAKTFVEANLQRNHAGDVNTRELGELIRGWWDEKGTPKRLQENEPAQTWQELGAAMIESKKKQAAMIESKKKQAALNQSRIQQEASWANIGPEDKVSQIQDEEAHKKEISARQDGWIDPGSSSKEA